MTDGMPFFPPEASTIAGRIDRLYFALIAMTSVIVLLIAAFIIVFSIRYRRRHPDEAPEQTEGGLRLEIAWTIVPAIVGIGLFVWAARLYMDLSYVPRGAMDVFVVGKQWMWKVQYSGGQHEINELHVPVGRPVRLTMISQDVIHSFFVPAFRVKMDVRPDRYSVAWFEATKTGRYHLFCAEYCGTSHAKMQGWVTVMEPAAFQAWLEERPTGSLAALGEQLFLQLGCASCHRSDELRSAPVLEGIYGREVPLADGRFAHADDNYLRESILVPAARVARGFQTIMPSFQGRLTEEQIQQLIAYIRSLRDVQPALRPQSVSPAIPGAQGEPVPPVGLPGRGTPGDEGGVAR